MMGKRNCHGFLFGVGGTHKQTSPFMKKSICQLKAHEHELLLMEATIVNDSIAKRMCQGTPPAFHLKTRTVLEVEEAEDKLSLI